MFYPVVKRKQSSIRVFTGNCTSWLWNSTDDLALLIFFPAPCRQEQSFAAIQVVFHCRKIFLSSDIEIWELQGTDWLTYRHFVQVYYNKDIITRIVMMKIITIICSPFNIRELFKKAIRFPTINFWSSTTEIIVDASQIPTVLVLIFWGTASYNTITDLSCHWQENCWQLFK